MPTPGISALREESRKHTRRSLELFAEASELQQKLRELPTVNAKTKALHEVYAKELEAIAEMRKAAEIQNEFMRGLREHLANEEENLKSF